MIQLNLPPFGIRLTRRADKVYIWDILRQRTVRLTPEEWVRQHFVHYLIEHLDYPPTLMMNEVSIALGELSRRVDTILYDRSMTPLMLVEYKAPSVPLSQRTLDQIVRYNYALRVPYLLLSNGLEHRAYHIDYVSMSYRTLDHIPPYATLTR